MKRVIVSSYNMAVGAASRVKYWTTATCHTIRAVCSKAKQWAKTIGFWILSGVVLFILCELASFAVIKAPTTLLPRCVEWCLSTVSRRYSSLLGNYNTGMSPYMAAFATGPEEYCSSYLGNFIVGLFLVRALTRLVQKQARVNLNLCSVTRGPSCRGVRCGVCWGDMDADDDTILHNACQHSWHIACIEDMAKFEQESKGYAPCPICREPMNQESKIGGLLRSLPSGVQLRDHRLERLCAIACFVNKIFATISLAVFLAGIYLVADQQSHPLWTLVVPSTAITIAAFVAVTALALEQLFVYKQFLLLRPKFARLLINAGFLMALIAAGCQIEVPETLTVNQLAEGWLRHENAAVPNLATVNWWVWLGQGYTFYSSIASAGLIAALMTVSGAWEFDYV